MSKYGQLVQGIISAIERGDYRRGDALPSLRQLVQQHTVSLNTARRAYYELERLGFAEAQPRRGYVVAAGASAADDRLIAPLGAPFPHPALYDTRALSHAFVGAMRHYHQALAEPALAGLPALRRQLARNAAAEGWELHADEVLITCGGMEALSLAIAAVTHGVVRPTLAVLLPAFPGLLGWLAEHGVALLPLQPAADGTLDTTALQAALARGEVQGIALMTAFAHPHGRSLPAATQQQLLALAERYDVAVIEDDAYRQLGFDEQMPLPLRAADRGGRVLLCGTFSKSLAPGYRVGWLLPGRYAELARRLKVAQTLASPLPNQLALAELLSGGRHLPGLCRLRQQLAERVRALEAALRPLLPPGCALPAAEGAYFVWLEQLPADCVALAAEAQQHGIQLAPGTLCQPGDAGRHALRLNASYFDAASQQPALDWLARALRRGT
ncbi:PLP-dependent aminotransferase family protein [Vogesella sp. GCM10023246]|uniref:Putative 8-amino-7-oxononanoate synthase n=1 Tax=Vogesella oryzagri TaxID=3160864 RepID=A0ABV1M3C0_9NEIS